MEKLSVAQADWFAKPETQAVFACLNRDGFEARAVGGAVRDTLLQRPVSEIDFATTAKPWDIVRLAEASGSEIDTDRYRPRNGNACGQWSDL